MSAEIFHHPKPGSAPLKSRQRIKRPCDHKLDLAVMQLETQLGTIEAYNRLVEAADRVKAKIEAGKAQPQNPLYTVNVKGGD